LDVLNTLAHSSPNPNSNYIGWPAHSAAQCKRPAQYSRNWAGLPLLAVSMRPITSRKARLGHGRQMLAQERRMSKFAIRLMTTATYAAARP
jgi:hypothetical protein